MSAHRRSNRPARAPARPRPHAKNFEAAKVVRRGRPPCPRRPLSPSYQRSRAYGRGYLALDAKWAAAKAASPVTPTDQEDDDMRKPWEEEGISRATWYRRHLQKRGETAVPETETVRQACETGETACETGAPSHVPVLDETAPETMQPPADAAVLPAENAENRDQVSRKSTDQPWRLSEADAARRADQYRAARKEKGELIATRALRWGLQDAGVLYEQLEREVDRIRALAASGRAILRG
jgi:hypothetical protein